MPHLEILVEQLDTPPHRTRAELHINLVMLAEDIGHQRDEPPVSAGVGPPIAPGVRQLPFCQPQQVLQQHLGVFDALVEDHQHPEVVVSTAITTGWRLGGNSDEVLANWVVVLLEQLLFRQLQCAIQ